MFDAICNTCGAAEYATRAVKPSIFRPGRRRSAYDEPYGRSYAQDAARGDYDADDREDLKRAAQAGYFGVHLDDRSLVPDGHAQLGTIRLEDWVRQPKAR